MASMFFVALTNSVGGFETIDPNIVLGDGKFTLFVVKTANIFEILQLLAQVLNGGRHLENSNVLYTHTSFVKAESMDGSRLMINLDGEYGGDAPTTFTNHQQHIKIIGNTSDYADPIEEVDEGILEGAGTGFMKEVETLHPDEVNDKRLPYDGKN
jgi:diacylglycerol kinase (ATP)